MKRWLSLLAFLCIVCPITSEATPFCVNNLGSFDVHETNKPRFGTPIVTGPDGSIYITYIDPTLQTVIRQYSPSGQAWSSPTILTTTTHSDPWHTQPSVGIDQQGFIHAVYNHHNTPWQYKVSNKPHNITDMIFTGQPAGLNPGKGQPEKSGNCEAECEANWYSDEPNIAAIPGNQITYPTFANTVDGALFIGYRECLKCSAQFHDRQWSLGMSKYNQPTHTWHRVAGIKPWATTPGKVALGLKVVGDVFGQLHASWLWCNEYTEEEGGQACFAHPNFISYAVTKDQGLTWFTSNNATLTMPLNTTKSEVVIGPEWFDNANATGYFDGNTTLSVDNTAKPTIVIYPNTTDSDKKIKRSYITRTSDQWTSPVILDYSPTLVYKDNFNRWIAVSSGLRIHVSSDDRQTWQLYPIDTDQGAYTFVHDNLWLLRTGQLRLYAQSSTTNRLTIYSFTFTEGNNCGN